MNSAGSIEERNMRSKHSEIGSTPVSDDPEYNRREIGLASRRSEDVMESLMQKFQTNTMESMQFLTHQTNEALQSVGLQLRGANTNIDKLKEQNDNKYNRMNEKITTMEKMMTMLEDPNERGSGTKTQEDQNKKRAVVTGFHDDTTQQEVQDMLREIITSIEMPIDQIQNKCPAKPITHAFLQFNVNVERGKFVRSANILKKELRGRTMKIFPAIDAEERFHQKRLGYLKCCIHLKRSE